MDPPLFITSSPNEPIVIGEGKVETVYNGANVEGDAQLVLKWLPNPRVDVVASFRDPMAFWKGASTSKEPDPLPLNFPTLGFSSSIWVRRQSLGQHCEIVGSLNDLGLPTQAPDADTVDFHLANVPELYAKLNSQNGSSAKLTLSLVSDEWQVEVRPVRGIHQLINDLSESSGYAITYHCELRRTDAQLISLETASKMLDHLDQLFTFGCGHRTPPLLARGRMGTNIVWQERQVRRVDQWRTPFNWLDWHRAEALEELFPGFVELSSSELWAQPLRSVLYWYAHSNVGVSGADTGIVLSQAALELLAWTSLVSDERSLSSDGFEKLPAADRIRLVLNGASIPLAIPAQLIKTQRLGKAYNWADGPAAITALRNSIVHPNVDKRLRFGDAMGEVWLLSQWYVELLILRRCGFNGVYGPRLRSRWKGQVERVPWAV